VSATISELPLSPTQRYFLGVIAQEGYDPTWQHVSLAIEFGRDLDLERVADVVARLEARHPLLAARLVYRDGEPYLRDCSGSGRSCTPLDLRQATRSELGICVAHAVDAPFDLLRGPLWRVVVAEGPDGRNVVVFVCHHLVGDGISTWVLLKDFGVLYFGGELDPEPEPYEAFVHAQQELLTGSALERRLEYWRGALDGARPLLPVPRRPHADQLGAGELRGLAFEAGAGAAVMGKARDYRVTPLSLLAGATLSGVKRATGQDDVVCAVVADARGGRFAQTVGAFSDLMFVRDPPSSGDERARLTALRNAFFAGWKHHLPIACLRERLECFDTGGTIATNPCDVYLNFIPVKTSSDWWNRIAPYGDKTLDFYAMQNRNPPPTRRMLGPLFFFIYTHAADLYGVVAVHRHEALAELNGAVVSEMETAVKEMVEPALATGPAPV
jgi:hypothetical protein